MPTAGPRPASGVRTYVAIALLVLSLASLRGLAVADDGASGERILADLNAAIQWFRDVRVTLRAARGTVGVPLSGDEEALARQALDRAFAAARAKAALLRSAGAPVAATEEQRAVDARAQVQQAIRDGEAAVAGLQARARRTPAAQRAALERELTGARNRVELDRARLAFLAQLHAFDAAQPGMPMDLTRQIDTLQVSVPELKATGAAAEPTVLTTPTPAVGTWSLLQRLVALRQTRSAIDELVDATTARRRAVTADLQSTRTELQTLGARLHELADTRDAPPDMSAEQREFQASLARARELAAALVPLAQEAALLRRFTDDMQSWQRAVDGGTAQLLKAVGIDLLRLLAAIGAVLLAAALWRMATLRYVADPMRRRLVLGFRKVVLVVAVTIVVVVHFASELTTLVTALGFAAAGIAFALQNVILAVAGYFSMMAPNGIRVGDRVSLQGPFGYVHGEVLEIGFVRVRLRELAGDPLVPTGRLVVFPNSVVFTGSFFKHPDGATSPPGASATKAA